MNDDSRIGWSEGVCGDGAAILYSGVMVPVEDVVATLERYELALHQIVGHGNITGERARAIAADALAGSTTATEGK